MPDEMRDIRRKMRGPDAHEARSSMLSQGRDAAEQAMKRAGDLAGYFGFGKRRIDITIEEQFHEAWIVLAILLTIAGLLFRFEAFLVIGAMLITIVAVSWVWNRLALFGLTYQRNFSVKRAFVGEDVELELTVSNHKFLPLPWLEIKDIYPVELPLQGIEIIKRADTNQGELTTVWSMKWYETVKRPYQFKASARGFYRFGPTKVETGDLFGLFLSTHRREDDQLFIVYPKVVPLTSLGLPAKEPFGDQRAPLFMFEDPVRTVGIRDYRPEDDFRRVHWKASARRQTLQTRVLEPASTHNLIVCLNVATLEQHWRGVIVDALEQVVSIAASVCYHSIEQRWQTGLLANGALPRSDQPIKVPPGRSPDQITALLEMLAAVTPFATAPIEKLLAAESPRLPWGSTLVVISALVTESLAATLLDLKQMGRRVVLISLDPTPPPAALKDILVYQVKREHMEALDLGQPVSGEQAALNPDQLQQQAIQQAGALLAQNTEQLGMADFVEDYELGQIVRERQAEKDDAIEVDINEL